MFDMFKDRDNSRGNRRDTRPSRRGDTRPDDRGERRGFQPNPAYPKGERKGAEEVEYNVQCLLRDLYGDDVSTRLEDADTHWKINVVCPTDFRGRVIGTQGRMINAIRTIAGSFSAQRKVQVQIDLEE
jgi:predicted RNA-binding protein YlqC (UPF0109 family)